MKTGTLSLITAALTLPLCFTPTLQSQENAAKKSSVYVKKSAKDSLVNFKHADPTHRMEKELRIQVEWIELSHKDFTKLMEDYDSANSNVSNSSNDGPLRAKIKEMIEKEDAEIIDTSIVLARSGQRAKVESVMEVIYPTAYDRPKIEKDSYNKKGGSANAADNEDSNSKTGEKSVRLPVATAYETRNVGTTFEVDPVIGADDRTIDLSMSPEIVYHVGHEEYGFYKDGESEVAATMPVFYTMKLTTQVTMNIGEYLFAGVQSPFSLESMKADRERKVMVFVKTDLLYVGLPFKEEQKVKKK